jgi:hypothetical protein
MILISYCFGIGYRCNTDDFLSGLDIRKYSSPFSYMIIDLETSLQFIVNKFNNFTDTKYIENHNYKWNNQPWQCKLFFNKLFLPTSSEMNINQMKRICCWNHHNLNDENIINTLKRRYTYLIDSLEKEENTLLLYIENIQIYSNDDYESYYNKDLCNDFLKNRKNVYICILVPLLNYEKKPFLYQVFDNLHIIFYKSNMNGSINEYTDKSINWHIIENMILLTYNFVVNPKNNY